MEDLTEAQYAASAGGSAAAQADASTTDADRSHYPVRCLAPADRGRGDRAPRDAWHLECDMDSRACDRRILAMARSVQSDRRSHLRYGQLAEVHARPRQKRSV